jgi:AcrR family transcriptional regulator
MSDRRAYLLEASYRYVLEHGLTDLSLRPLAQAIGSSPRVLLFLFGSKDELIRELLARARQDELELLDRVTASHAGSASPAETALVIWEWLADPAHRGLLTLWVEVYARSLQGTSGPLEAFGRQSVADWLPLLEGTNGAANATALLAILRGGLLDLLATGDRDRVDAGIRVAIQRIAINSGSRIE